MGTKQLFNNGWQFVKQPIGTEYGKLSGSDITWENVDIPHDWLIYDTKKLYETGEGWYRKYFVIENREDRRISVCFEGIYMNSTVYVNDRIAGEWKYGYSSFEFDITDFLRTGENEIRVRVVYQSPNSRWYSGAGIYRNVWFITTSLTHLVSNGIYITTKKDKNFWRAEIETEAVTEGKCQTDAVIRQTIYDTNGVEIQSVRTDVTLPFYKEIKKISQTVKVENPILWSLSNRYLYTLKTEVLAEGRTVDEVSQTFGFRTTRFTPDQGFFLNDTHVKLHGVCNHHDLGCLGAAVNKTALKRQLSILKEMGVNSIRTSHNMPAPELMELADEMGFLIVSEVFDMWERSKTDYDYGRFFHEWHERDVASWIRRDRNHPSIIMWSIGNEIYDTHAGARGMDELKMLKALVHFLDPGGNGAVTFGSNYMPWENTQKCAPELEAVGYNYAERLYEEHHKKHPDWVIYGSETAATVQSRGIYHFPASQPMLSNDDEQCSSLGNGTTSWGSKSTADNIIDDRDAEFCLGQYIWSGFDYIGEPTPYFTKNSYFGQIDTAGFPKDSYYLYQAEWTDYRKKPMVHILPYWDFNEGQLIDIKIYSNAPKTELFFNGESKGCFEIDHEHGKQLSGTWQLPYHPGTIKAVAYDEHGNVIAVDEQSSFGDAASIMMEPDKTELKADGQDLIFVTITTADKEGKYAANANNRMEVEVTGAGRLAGLDNGNSTDYDQYKGTSRRLFSGKLLAVIAAKFEAGEIRVKVSSTGLKEKELILYAVKAPIIPGVSEFLTENIKSEPNAEIPIRKINLISHGTKYLNASERSVLVTAHILPENATYDRLKWKAVTNRGVETNIAEITVRDNEAEITAKGDGAFRLRCSADNGSTRSEIMSDMEFEISGIGSACVNPYEFVSAALYNAGSCDLGNGNLFGVATLPDKRSYVGFRNIDFGEYGSDEITLPIFYNSNDPLPIEIWEGIPDEEGCEKLAEVIYHRSTIWNTYQSQTFKLPRRIRGNTVICFVFRDKVHFKGFCFKKPVKAYEKLMASENNRIFGDSFQVNKNAVEQIGNNVVLEFENMDFTDKGFTKITICGRSHIDVNTIHIRFHSEHGDVNQIVEFPFSEDYQERTFVLNSVTGDQKVSFVFLPGSKFDFKWFCFE